MAIPEITLSPDAPVLLEASTAPAAVEVLSNLEGNYALMFNYTLRLDQDDRTWRINARPLGGTTPGAIGEQEDALLYQNVGPSFENEQHLDMLQLQPGLFASSGSPGARSGLLELEIDEGPAALADFGILIVRWPSPRL